MIWSQKRKLKSYVGSLHCSENMSVLYVFILFSQFWRATISQLLSLR